MAEQFGNQCSTSIAIGGYTAGSGILNVLSTASPWPSTGTFTVQLQNTQLTLLRVTAVNSGSQWAVTAEANDANATAETMVFGTILSVAAFAQIKNDITGSGYGVPITSCNTYTGANTGWTSYSAIARIPGSILLAYPASWRVRFAFLGGSPVIGAINVKRTLPYSTAVIDTTAITIGGSATPTLTTPNIVNSDIVNLQLDVNHDYYITMFFTSAGANASVSSGNGGAITFIAGYYSDDATGLTTIPTISGNGNSFAVCLTQP